MFFFQSPTDFSIQVYDPETLLVRFNASVVLNNSEIVSTTRRKYARIRLVDTGIRTPLPHNQHKIIESAPVPFIVILEPLYFGVLPATVIPTLFFLVPVLAVAALAVPLINTYLADLARQGRRDVPYKEE
jgi:hypothetical protein